MGAASLLSLGVKAMAASQAALQTTGHNVGNANVAGYSRQRVELATAQGTYTGAGFFGGGVDVAGVTRLHDEFLTREAATMRSAAAMDGARLTQLRALDPVFRGGEQGLGQAANRLLQAFGDLASRPADPATRQVVLARAADLAGRFGAAADALDAAGRSTASALQTGVLDVNALTRDIASLNGRIAAFRGLGQPANDLLDQRDVLVSRLAAQLRVTRVEADDGSLTLFAGGGQRLVLGTEAVALRVVADEADGSRGAVAVAEYGSVRRLDAAALGGGALAGLLTFQNGDLVDAQARLGQLAAAIGMGVNAQQQAGLNLQPPAGTRPGEALFGLGPAPAVPGADNARDAAGLPLGSVTITRVDGRALRASDYELAEDAASPSGWSLTRLADDDPRPRPVGDGEVVDGFRIDFGSPGPQPGDRFRLQPTGQAASGMKALLSDPRDVAAAAPVFAPDGTPLGRSDNANAVALEGLRDAAIVDGRTLVDGSVVDARTVLDAWADAMAAVGSRVQSAITAADLSGAVAERQEALRSAGAGVNLDEEAANLIHFQQSYQAAAKVLQVAQTLFDTLLQAAAGR